MQTEPAAVSSAPPHPQLTTEEMLQLRWLLGGALMLLSVWTVWYMDVGASVLMAVTALVIIVATLRPELPARVPRWVHRLSFSFVTAFFTADLWLTGEVLPAIVRLDLLLLLYRGLAYRKRRDDLQIVVLGLFLIVLGGVLNVSLAFAAQILAFTAGALLFLLAITLSASTGDEAPGRSGAAEGVPAWARHVRWRRVLGRLRQVTDWRVVALAAGLFAGLVVLSAVLFLAIPRFQLENSFFLERFITKKTKSGFSDTIRFGEVTEITLDNSVALSVDVSDRSRIPAAPYWRMLVLDDYREGTFRLSPGLRRLAFGEERSGVNVPGAAAGAGEDPVYWTFYLESGVSRFLPLLGRFETLRFRERQNYRHGRNLGVVELRSEPATMLAYRVEGMDHNAVLRDERFAAQSQEHGDRRWSARGLMLQLGVDENDRAVLRQLVAEIMDGGVTPSSRPDAPAADSHNNDTAARVNVSLELTRTPSTDATQDASGAASVNVPEFLQRAEAWLERRHAYSLSPRIPAGPGDPLVRWLRSSESGHCELFAGSLVLLARSAGLPARVVTGFRGGSWNGFSNNFTLRNSDAHAWCEVFDAAAGAWLRADPTPGSAAGARDSTLGEASLARRFDRSWTARLDSLRVFWYRRIVNFDQQSQLETLRAVKEASERSGRRLREALERWSMRVRDWLAAPWSGGRAAVLVAITGAVWAIWSAGGMGVFRWRIRGRRRAGDAVRNEAGRWLRRFAARESHRVRDDGGANARGGERDVMTELQRLRFGAQETWGDVPGVFRRARRVWKGSENRRRRV